MHHRPELLELPRVIPEDTVLDRAPPSARSLIPPIGKRNTRRPGARIDVHKDQRKGSEDDLRPRGRAKRDRGQPRADEMVTRRRRRKEREVGGKRMKGVQFCVLWGTAGRP
jgi:hypothetical protein